MSEIMMRKKKGGHVWPPRRENESLGFVSRRQWNARLGTEQGEQSPHRATRENQADEEEDRAERFVPPQVHEIKDDEHELHERKHHKTGDDDPLRERQVNADNLDARDDREEHRDLDVDLEFADVMTVVVLTMAIVTVGSYCVRGAHWEKGGVKNEKVMETEVPSIK
jgi:hypothetical protein